METIRRRSVLPVLATVLWTACGSTDAETSTKPVGPEGVTLVRSSQPYEIAVTVDATDRAALRDSERDFAFALYREVASRAAPDENLFLGTRGIATVLAMTYAGAQGTTETEMAATLRTTLPQAAFHPAMNELSQALRASLAGTDVRYDSYNSIWLAKDNTVSGPFLDVLSVNYDTGVYLADFVGDPEGARTSINAWVAQRSEGLIPELFAPGAIDAMTVLALTNAAFLSAPWQDRFDATNTQPGEFTLPNENVVDVPMMARQWRYPFAFDIDWRALELPFRDTTMSAVFVLPNDGEFAEFEASFDAVLAQRIVAGLEAWQENRELVVARVPRFSFSSTVDLRPSLEAMGMVTAFDPGMADFEGIEADREVFIDTLVHRTTVGVDEDGMTGAVATGEILAYMPITPEIKLTRPFLFFVHDHATGAVLFVGRVVRPAGDSHTPAEPPVAKTDAELICGRLAAQSCPGRTTTEAECLTALESDDAVVLEQCADCIVWGIESHSANVCDSTTCVEHCPGHAF